MIWTIFGIGGAFVLVYIGAAIYRGMQEGRTQVKVGGGSSSFLGQCKDMYDKLKKSMFSHKDCD